MNASAITLVFLIACLVLPRHSEPYFRSWLVASGMFALGVLTVSLQFVHPEWPLGYVASAAACVGAWALLQSGLRYRGESAAPRRLAWVMGALFALDAVLIATGSTPVPGFSVLGHLALSLGHMWFGWRFWPRVGDAPGLGAGLVALCSMGWGLHNLDAPLMINFAPALMPYGFWLSALLIVALGVGMILHMYERSSDREQQLGRTLNQTNQELLRAIDALTDTRAQAELSAAVAREQEALVRQIIHDLRNATQAMSLIAEEIEAAAEGEARILTPLGALERQVRFISNFLKEKLAWIVERGDLPGEGCELGQAFEGLEATFGPIFASKHQRLLLEPPPAAAISTSSVRFDQILGNLLRNAHQHCPDGASVRVWTAVSDGWATFYVADDGPGIALEEQGRLGRRPARPDGTGQGLRTVQDLVTEAGGLFGLVSEAGRGATCYVTLPLVWWGLRVPGEPAREEATELGI